MSDEQRTKATTQGSAAKVTGQVSAFPFTAPLLPDSQKIFRQLFEFAPDGILVVDMLGLIRQANPQTKKLFGYIHSELIGKPIEMLIPERFATQYARYRDAYPRKPRTRAIGANLNLSARRQDNSEFSVDIMLSPVETEYGRVVLAVVRDITERKKAEDNYRQARDDAEAASRAKDQFIAVLSHELRTPLTPALTAVQMMEAEPGLTNNLRDWTSMIRRNVQLEAKLIDVLLDVTKISRGKVELQLEAVDLNEALRQATKICESEIWSKQLRLTARFDARDHWVRADAVRPQQILWNLLKNAVKFTPSGGAISVRTENL